MSLSPSPTTTILPVTDPERARHFYADTLGLPFIRKGPEGNQIFAVNDSSTISLIEKPAGAQAEHAALSFEVPDIAMTMAELERNGVKFEDYDLPGLKTFAQISAVGSEKAAWFKDPDGNILCLHQGSTRL